MNAFINVFTTALCHRLFRNRQYMAETLWGYQHLGASLSPSYVRFSIIHATVVTMFLAVMQSLMYPNLLGVLMAIYVFEIPLLMYALPTAMYYCQVRFESSRNKLTMYVVSLFHTRFFHFSCYTIVPF